MGVDRVARADLKLYDVRSLGELETLRESWNDLLLLSPSSTPFQSWEWNFGRAKFENDHVHLRVVVAEDAHNAVVGIAPFWIRPIGWPRLGVLEFIGSHGSGYSDLLFLESYKDDFVRCVTEWIEECKEWRILHLRNLRADSVGLISRHSSFKVQPYAVSPYALLPHTMREYERTLPKKLRENMRRRNRPLITQGRLTFSVCETASQLRTELRTFFDLHQRRQRAKGERGRFFNPRWRQAFEEMSLMLWERGFVRLGMLRVDGRPAACSYALRFREREHSYLTGMAPDLTNYSLGHLLKSWMIEAAIKDGVRVYDFGKGNEQHKSWWANQVCQVSAMTGARSRLDALRWQRWESWQKAIYRSRLMKRLYLSTVGRRDGAIQEDANGA
jgi:CelD/BcsL family acetyltransferase involved in cellulose biosynthesis